MSNSAKETKETKKNFLRQFRDESSLELKQLTATQFMEIWSHYDTDGLVDLFYRPKTFKTFKASNQEIIIEIIYCVSLNR